MIVIASYMALKQFSNKKDWQYKKYFNLWILTRIYL
jgi:hypothetical protein